MAAALSAAASGEKELVQSGWKYIFGRLDGGWQNDSWSCAGQAAEQAVH